MMIMYFQFTIGIYGKEICWKLRNYRLRQLGRYYKCRSESIYSESFRHCWTGFEIYFIFLNQVFKEEYAHLRCLGYPQTDVFLLCFSLVDKTSLENCQYLWMPEIRKYVGDDVPVILVGTKQDLHETAPPQEKIDLRQAEQIAKEVSFDYHHGQRIKSYKNVWE